MRSRLSRNSVLRGLESRLSILEATSLRVGPPVVVGILRPFARTNDVFTSGDRSARKDMLTTAWKRVADRLVWFTRSLRVGSAQRTCLRDVPAGLHHNSPHGRQTTFAAWSTDRPLVQLLSVYDGSSTPDPTRRFIVQQPSSIIPHLLTAVHYLYFKLSVGPSSAAARAGR